VKSRIRIRIKRIWIRNTDSKYPTTIAKDGNIGPREWSWWEISASVIWGKSMKRETIKGENLEKKEEEKQVKLKLKGKKIQKVHEG
jgi:hypothetical protein